MKWQQHSKYALVSECGTYSVAKVGSASGRYSYESWRTEKHPLGRLQLATNLPDAITARLRCEADEQTQ